MNNKYFETKENKYLNKNINKFNNLNIGNQVKSDIIQKRMISKASSTTDFDWFDGRKFSEVQNDPNFIANANKLTPYQYQLYINAAKNVMKTKDDKYYPIAVAVPDLAQQDISTNATWYIPYMFEQILHDEFYNAFLKDWKKYIPPGVEGTEDYMMSDWDNHRENTLQSWREKYNNFDDVYNPFGDKTIGGTREDNSSSSSGGYQNNGVWSGYTGQGLGYGPNVTGRWTDFTTPKKPKSNPSNIGYGLGYGPNVTGRWGTTKNPWSTPTTKTKTPDYINYITNNSKTETKNPFAVTVTPLPAPKPITPAAPKDIGVLDYIRDFWEGIMGGNEPTPVPKEKENKPRNPGEYSPGVNVLPTRTPKPSYTPSPTATPKKEARLMNKMMGGKSGRMGPEILDKDGTKGRYFQKKAKKQSVNTYKFYETDKPHAPQMQSMRQNMLTKAQTAKMHEITDENYYGDEKPRPKNTFRKNSLAMGNSINMGGSFAPTVMPRKKSFSLTSPRAKKPTASTGIGHNPFFKPEGGSLKQYNAYPRSGSLSTGMPPTMTGGFNTAKRLTKKSTAPVKRHKYGC